MQDVLQGKKRTKYLTTYQSVLVGRQLSFKQGVNYIQEKNIVIGSFYFAVSLLVEILNRVFKASHSVPALSS